MFIVFEGIDGVGKSSHIRGVSKFLVQKGIPHISTSEFGNLTIGKLMKNIMVNYDLDGKEELSIICAIRSYHYRKVLEPAITANHWILMDRFVESTWAYQCGGAQISEEIVQTFMNMFTLPKPDLTILLEGRNHRTRKKDKFDFANQDFIDRVANKYNERFDHSSWLKYNTNLSYQTVQNMIINDLGKRFSALVD